MRHRRRPQLARHAGTAVALALLTVGMAACTPSQAPQGVGPPDRPARVVDGLLTGLHEPEASHLDLLGAFLDGQALERAYAAALGSGYLWHEFGDVCLLLPGTS